VMLSKIVQTQDLAAIPEDRLVALARAGDTRAVRFIIQAHNRRLYRVARAVLRDDDEAEDVVQETYVRAFAALTGFRGSSSLATWLTRIALNEALGRRRRQRTKVALELIDAPEQRDRMQVIPFPHMKTEPDPEQIAARNEVRRMLERAVDNLAEPFRIVLVLRDLEELTVEETAQQLGLRPVTVRTRLHRARAQLREALDSQLASTLTETFPFGGARCARVVDAVLRRLAARLAGFETTKEERV
jgi:RNA polymerase sigma-70 factor (ECF subfamily)